VSCVPCPALHLHIPTTSPSTWSSTTTASSIAYDESDPAEADRETIIRNFLTGQYSDALRVVVMEAGRRWKDEDIPKNNWDLGVWSPEGDYLPEGDRLLIFKPEVHTAEWSAA
jgi:hypothetical protein